MRLRRRWSIAVLALVVALVLTAGIFAELGRVRTGHYLSAQVGAYRLSFTPHSTAITLWRAGRADQIQMRELGGSRALDVLPYTRSVTHSGPRWTFAGVAPWAAFRLILTAATVTGRDRPPGSILLHLSLAVKPSRDAPGDPAPDISIIHARRLSVRIYATAPPVAGNNLFLSDARLGSTILYFSDYTALGPYFDRTQSGVTQPNFPYPGAGAKGSLVGVSSDTFGYVPPPNSLGSLPHDTRTVAVSSYLYLEPRVPSSDPTMAAAYLRGLVTVTRAVGAPTIPTAHWKVWANRVAANLAVPSNWVTVAGHRYLRSYVSDTRSAPELLTQVGVLAGIKAYELRRGVKVPFASALEADLPTFYDAAYRTVTNSLPHDPAARGESWYVVNNLISLLQLAQMGDTMARALLLRSAGALVELAHVNRYAFPQNFAYRDLNGSGSQVEHDVAGGYAWLMLGLYDLTSKPRYLTEAKLSLAHVAGTGFDLSYETHMSAYTAAAAQRLYTMTGDPVYHGYAVLALANFFHAVRLWDCTYGNCSKGGHYHTYMGLNPLPWSDYIAMLEQYEAWLGLRNYMRYAHNEPAYLTNLVTSFLSDSPRTLQYSLPPLLPSGVASSAAGEYPFVPHNNLRWYIPLEDLREGEATSGAIGQEIYGTGGPFVFGAYSP